MKNNLIEWLLEEKKPEMRLRTQVELIEADQKAITKTINLLKNTKDFEKI